jgi:hypothetical protein
VAWSQIVGTGAAGAGVGTAPHADSRNMVWVPAAGGNYLLEVSDGGITRLLNPDSASRVWE